MSETARLLDTYGLTVFAAAFLIATFFLGRWLVKSIEREREDAKEERAAYLTSTKDFSQVVSNHMDHETAALTELNKQNIESFRELTKAIDRLCIYLEMPNKDY